MSQIDKNKLIKMLAVIALIMFAVWIAARIHQKTSLTLQDYADLHPELAQSADPDGSGEKFKLENPSSSDASGTNPHTTGSDSTDVNIENSGTSGADGSSANPSASGTPNSDSPSSASDASGSNNSAPSDTLTGALLNGGPDGKAMLAQRVALATDESGQPSEDFYFEPLSENLRRYITGVSYPALTEGEKAAITYDDLRYLHVLHYNFDGQPTAGELICNQAIAVDLLEIFYELYQNEYQIEKMLLIDEYDGDDLLSMEDNNTSCFNYRVVEGSASLSKHALGLALDINPFYNPYVTYPNGTQRISPADAAEYADRTRTFPYKIDENDLCYKLFTQHGFIWGGNWNSLKDYQHFQKTIK